MKRYVKGMAFLLSLALFGTSVPVSQTAFAAKKAGEVQEDAAGKEAPVAENPEGAGKETPAAEPPGDAAKIEKQPVKPLVEVTADAFDEHLMGKAYKEGKFSIKESAFPGEVTIKEEKNGDGLFVSGDTGAVSSTRFALGTFCFENYTAGRMILGGLVERRNNASVYFYMDEEKESFASIKLGRQKKKDSWDVVKYMCADVSGKKITGTHQIYAVPVFDDVKEKNVLTGKKAKIYLKGLLFSEGSMPVVDFNIDESLGSIADMNGDSSHESECYGNVTVQVPEGYVSEYSKKTFQSGTYELDYVRGRGNSTWYAPKRPYKFKLMEKQDFFGMGSNKHWVLLANYYDYTMLRNKYTYWLGKELGMEYTPECVFVDMVMNGEYLGSYYLCEQVRVGKARVDIDDLEDQKEAADAETISGGYLLSMGSDSSENSNQKTIKTEHDYYFLIENPEFDTYFNESQYNYISNYMNQVEKAIYGEDFKDEKGISYAEYLDVQAAIDYYLVQEFSLNGDGYLSGSTYLYKKRNGKLYWGPLWDFDYVAWGATETREHTVGDFIHAYRAPWMSRLLQNEDFRNRLLNRWKELREILKKSIQDNGQLDQYAKQLYLSQKVNYYVADSVLSDENMKDEKGTPEEVSEEPYEVNFDNEVARLKRWISERIQWVDENIETLSNKENGSIRLMTDDKLYAELTLDREGYLSTDAYPADPSKDGYMFVGWYMMNEDGDEIRLKPGSYYESSEAPLVFYAKWLKGTPEEIIKGMQFDRDVYYIPVGYDEDDSWKINLTVMPFELEPEGITWSVGDEKIARIKENGEVLGVAQGETTVTAAFAGKTASCKVVVATWDDIVSIKEFHVASKLKIEKGTYAKIPLTYEPEENVLYRNWYFRYVAKDSMLLQTDPNGTGFVYAKKAGKTFVAVYHDSLERLEICEVEITDSSKKDVKKASQAKLGVTKKTVRQGGSYTIQVKKRNGQKASFSVSKKIKKKGISVTAKGKVKVADNAKKGSYKIVVKVKANKTYKAKKLIFRLKVVAGKS